MIMGFKVSYGAAVFFAGITGILFTRSDTMSYSLARHPDDMKEGNFIILKSLPNEKKPECGPLSKSSTMILLPDILPLDIFSQTDPLQYLFEKFLKIGTSRNNILTITGDVNYAIGTKRLPSCYMPYINVLLPLLKCWSRLLSVSKYIPEIRNQLFTNGKGLDSLPLEISSSSELPELFSSDIIFDPEPPLRLFIKLLHMPNDKITNLKMQLKNFQQKWWNVRMRDLPFSSEYSWYVYIVYELLKDESALDALKRNMDAIQQISTSNMDTISV